MTSMFLRLLQSCCSNDGEGIPRNQVNVQQILFEKHRDALIRITVNADSVMGSDWNADATTLSLFVPQDIDKVNPLGANLYTGKSFVRLLKFLTIWLS